jgi:carbohydrate kinase (thermoresistant glucokinase family)
MSRVVVMMGVSGSGKTTVAERVAAALGWMFQEGDKLHPAANVAKMAAGIALTDEDRWPWLDLIAQWIDARLHTGRDGIITCSALKRAYRERIGNGKPGVVIVYLHGDRATLDQHVHGRHHEYMPVTLLDSQLATLEEPAADEHVIEVDVGGSVEHTVAEVIRQLKI